HGSDPPLAVATSAASDTGLFAHATGRFTVAQVGSYVARVTGTDSHFLADTGSYRFFLYPVDRRPEHVPAAIAPGDTVVGEAIDVPGDVDEWRVSVPDSSGVNLVVQRGPDGPEGVLTAQLLDAYGRTVASAYSFGPGFGVGGPRSNGAPRARPRIRCGWTGRRS